MSRFTTIRIAVALLIFSGAFLIVKNAPQSNSHSPNIINLSQESPLPEIAGDRIIQAESSSSALETRVKRVVDGDTIELENGQKVRYIGINTPETVDPRKPIECFGKEASAKNRELVEGKTVILEKDISETDKYGRLLRYVYLPSQNQGSDQIFINDYLVRQGFAYASTYPPDVKYQNQFQQAQTEAQSKNLGLWSSCANASSSPLTSQQTEAQNQNCQIKGNISSSGEKIYHMPTQRYYDTTVIDESKGERWFCTEQAAIAAGWRKSKI